MLIPAFVITGAPALIIILVVLLLLVLGVVTLVRASARGAKRVVERVEGEPRDPAP